MNHLIGGAICWLLRRHAWRRLRKGEVITPDPLGDPLPADWRKRARICARCGAKRIVKARKAKT